MAAPKPQDNKELKTILLSYVFNSPTLVPWSVVEPYQNDLAEATEKILLWREAKQTGHRFRESDSVCEFNNPTLKMTIRRILRQKVNEGTPEEKSRLIGMECYWWATVNEAMLQVPLMAFRGRRVPGVDILEEQKEEQP